ncbi:MAG: 30S ribosome-binding factor RbfA [Candidatus Kapaibacterium sp.]
MSVRTEKVAGEVHKALSPVMDAFAREHGGGLLTITKVVMSPDLSIAKVYVSVFASKLAHPLLLKTLGAEAFRFKRALATELRLRLVPELRFFIDASLDEVERLTEILKANPPLHRESARDESSDHTTGAADSVGSHG